MIIDKKELREKFKKIRYEVKDKSIKSQLIAKKVIESEAYKNAKTVALYYALDYETDTTMLINTSLLDNKIVALPKVLNKTDMEFYKINSIEKIDTSNYSGIKEPSRKTENHINREDIDLIIIPGICFDANRNRIGFGMGYYDRYLSKSCISELCCHTSTIKIGICFDEQIFTESDIPVNEYDIKMDIVITDKHYYEGKDKYESNQV